MPKIKVSWLHFDLEFLKDDVDLLGFEAFADYMVPLREEFREREITSDISANLSGKIDLTFRISKDFQTVSFEISDETTAEPTPLYSAHRKDIISDAVLDNSVEKLNGHIRAIRQRLHPDKIEAADEARTSAHDEIAYIFNDHMNSKLPGLVSYYEEARQFAAILRSARKAETHAFDY